MSRLVILHTNDMHNVLARDEQRAARLMEIVEAERANPPVLLLDAGDAIGAGNLTFNPAGEAILERMTTIGYHAMTIGNREFHLMAAGFAAKTRGAPCPLLCANLRPKSPDVPIPVQPVWRTEHRGVRVAVLGLTVPMITPRMKVAALSAYLFDPPLETARLWVQRLRLEADLLIALTHLGIQHDRLLAEACPELDVILGGHSHTPTETPEQVGGVWLSHAPPFCKGATLLTLTRRNDRWELE